jgi:hypothetical protein
MPAHVAGTRQGFDTPEEAAEHGKTLHGVHPKDLEKSGHKFIGANSLYGSALSGDTKKIKVQE